MIRVRLARILILQLCASSETALSFDDVTSHSAEGGGVVRLCAQPLRDQTLVQELNSTNEELVFTPCNDRTKSGPAGLRR